MATIAGPGDTGFIPSDHVWGGIVTSAQTFTANGDVIKNNGARLECYYVTAISDGDTLAFPGVKACAFASNDPDAAAHTTCHVSAADTVAFDAAGGTGAGTLWVLRGK